MLARLMNVKQISVLDGRRMSARIAAPARATFVKPDSGGSMPNRNKHIDEMIANTPDWRGAALADLRRIIHQADPEIIEEVKWRRPSNPMGSAVFQHNGIVCIGVLLKERV